MSFEESCTYENESWCFIMAANDASATLTPFVLCQAYDQHLNMVLGDVEETVTTVETAEETQEEIIKVLYISFNDLCVVLIQHQTNRRKIELLFVRGDGVILISPPLRTHS